MKKTAKTTIFAIAIAVIAEAFAGIASYRLGNPGNSNARTITQPCEVAQIRASVTVFVRN